MATLKTFATKLGLNEAWAEERLFLESGIGLCQTCGSLKFNPDCPECMQGRWQSLLLGINAEERTDA
jgi:hypothetical protein